MDDRYEKVLISPYEDGEEEEIHYVNGMMIENDFTVCRKRIHPISSVRVRKFDVTCPECIGWMKEKKKEMGHAKNKVCRQEV